MTATVAKFLGDEIPGPIDPTGQTTDWCHGADKPARSGSRERSSQSRGAAGGARDQSAARPPGYAVAEPGGRRSNLALARASPLRRLPPERHYDREIDPAVDPAPFDRFTDERDLQAKEG